MGGYGLNVSTFMCVYVASSGAWCASVTSTGMYVCMYVVSSVDVFFVVNVRALTCIYVPFCSTISDNPKVDCTDAPRDSKRLHPKYCMQ